MAHAGRVVKTTHIPKIANCTTQSANSSHTWWWIA